MTIVWNAYLTDHLAGAAAAIELFERLFKANSALGDRLQPVYDDVRADREVLVELMNQLDLQPGVLKQTAGWAAERLLSLKHIVEGVTDDGFKIISLEMLSLGILGKYKLWTALAEARADGHPMPDMNFERLKDRALAQHALVEQERLSAIRKALQPPRDPGASNHAD